MAPLGAEQENWDEKNKKNATDGRPRTGDFRVPVPAHGRALGKRKCRCSLMRALHSHLPIRRSPDQPSSFSGAGLRQPVLGLYDCWGTRSDDISTNPESGTQ